MDSAAVRGHSGYNEATTPFSAFTPLRSTPGGKDDGLIARLHNLETYFDSFRTMIDHYRYRITNYVAYIVPDAYLSIHNFET